MSSESSDIIEWGRAQSNIFTYFRRGLTLPPEESTDLSTGERQIAGMVLELCDQAREELHSNLHISAVAVEPMRKGQTTQLPYEEMQKIIQRFYDVASFDRFADLLSREDKGIGETFRTKMDHLRAFSKIVLIGPVVALFTDTEGMSVLHSRFGGYAGGLALRLPIASEAVPGQPDALPGIILSEHVPFIIIDKEAEEKHSMYSAWHDNFEHHELWHVVEVLRDLLILNYHEKFPGFKGVKPVQSETFLRILGEDIFKPSDFAAFLNEMLEKQSLLLGMKPYKPYLPENAAAVLPAIHREVTANIAGKIDVHAFQSNKDHVINETAEEIVNGYVPLGGYIFFERLKWLSYENGEHVRTFNPAKDEELRDWLEEVRLNVGSFAGRSEYIQIVLDEYMNPGGRAARIREHISQQVKESLETFIQFSQFRNDPWAALFELSLFPFTRWTRYVRRRMK